MQPFKDVVDLSDHVIVVVRISRGGVLRNSRPCNQCLEVMIQYRIKKIVYSDEDGSVKCEKPENMKKMHVSSGWSAFTHPERLQ